MPDSPNKRLGLPRSHVVEVIERSQEEAIRTLTQAGVCEQRIRAVLRRIEAACRTALSELEAIDAEFREFAKYPWQDPEHTAYMVERIAFYQHQIEKATAVIVATEIQDAINEFQHPPVPHQPTITVTPASPGKSSWLRHVLHTACSVLLVVTWIAGLTAGLILSWFTGAPLFWALFWSGVTVVATALLWDWVGRSGWSLPIPLVAIGIFCAAVF